MRGPALADVASVKAVFSSPVFARALLYGLPALLPQIFPLATRGSVEALASAFIPQPQVTAS